MKNIFISKKSEIVFDFTYSVILSSVYFLVVMGIVIGINELMYWLKDVAIFSQSIVDNWLMVKTYIMYLDMAVLVVFVTIEAAVSFKELYFFAKEKLFD